MARYRITRLAQSDMQDIWDYTINHWSIAQAETYLAGLLDCLVTIADGRMPYKNVDHLGQNYKKATYGRHMIFFRIASDHIPDIIRILHVSMDIESRLQN